MKFLHLSDLHIGKNVNGFSMLDEQRHVFKQILMYIQSERPAAVVIAGDVYDRAMPSIEAVRLFDDFLTELAHENINILLISGNHDSPERLNYASRLLAEKNIHLCGVFDGIPHSVTLKDEYGDVNFWLMPFVKPPSVRGILGERETGNSYDSAFRAVLENTNINYSSRNILVAHQFFIKSGVELIRSESELNPVGGLDAINADMIERFDYVALGHLHRAQSVGSRHIRYAGSPLKYSFSECNHIKSATFVELHEKGNISISQHPFVPIHDMREITGQLDVLISKEVSSQADKKDYLRVILTDEEEIIDPMEKLRNVYPNIMSLSFKNLRTSIDTTLLSADRDKIDIMSHYDLFSEFFLEASGAVMSEGQASIARELLESTEGEL